LYDDLIVRWYMLECANLFGTKLGYSLRSHAISFRVIERRGVSTRNGHLKQTKLTTGSSQLGGLEHAFDSASLKSLLEMRHPRESSIALLVGC
jgi:hypothetical protein